MYEFDSETRRADERLRVLQSFAILDTPPERGFDDIVMLASQLCDTPVALVSLVDESRQWFKARTGFEPCETDLDSSVCHHALGMDEILEIEDLTADVRTASNPLVTSEPHIRFYAGAPLRTGDGVPLGTLCVIDQVPRPGGLTDQQRAGLAALAHQVMTQLELRRAIADREKAIEARDVGRKETSRCRGAVSQDVRERHGIRDHRPRPRRDHHGVEQRCRTDLRVDG